GRFGWAGGLIALAGMERGFPVVFAAGMGVKGVVEWVRTRRLGRHYLMFFAGFAGVATICFAASLFVVGLEGWRGFLDNMAVHTDRSAGFRIGLQHLFMLDGNLTGPDGFIYYAKKAELFAPRRVYYLLAGVAMLAPLILLARRMSYEGFTA